MAKRGVYERAPILTIGVQGTRLGDVAVEHDDKPAVRRLGVPALRRFPLRIRIVVCQGGIVFSSKGSIDPVASSELSRLLSHAATSNVFAKRPRRDSIVNVPIGTVPFRTALRKAWADT